MPNFLAGINTAASVATSFTGPTSSAAISSGVAVLGALTGGLGGLGVGSKPKALHTEFASGEANWQKPYGSNTDLVFYLVRADKGAQGTGSGNTGLFDPDGTVAFDVVPGLGVAENVGPTGQGFFGAASQTGPAFADGVQSSLNQVATFDVMSNITNVTNVAQGLAGPLTALGVDTETPLGGPSQTFSTIGSTASSVANITQSVSSLQAPRLSNASSAEFFQGVITQSFVPDAAIGGVRTAEQISRSISNGSISDLSTAMSIASGGVTTSTQLIEGINKGLIGFTTQGSGAQANRLGPKGLSRERQFK